MLLYQYIHAQAICIPTILCNNEAFVPVMQRITADEALNHRWFQEVPLPTCKELMPTFPPRHAGGH